MVSLRVGQGGELLDINLPTDSTLDDLKNHLELEMNCSPRRQQRILCDGQPLEVSSPLSEQVNSGSVITVRRRRPRLDAASSFESSKFQSCCSPPSVAPCSPAELVTIMVELGFECEKLSQEPAERTAVRVSTNDTVGGVLQKAFPGWNSELRVECDGRVLTLTAAVGAVVADRIDRTDASEMVWHIHRLDPGAAYKALDELEANPGVWRPSPATVTSYIATAELLCAMLERLNLLEPHGIERAQLLAFFFDLGEHYPRSNPFHNFCHALDVTSGTYICLRQLGAGALLSPLQQLALLLAAAGHDVGHPGTTNAAEARAQSTLFQRHGATSTLEKHHAELTLALTEKHQLLASLGGGPSEAEAAIDLIRYAIMGTDIALSNGIVEEFRATVAVMEGGEGIVSSSARHADLQLARMVRSPASRMIYCLVVWLRLCFCGFLLMMLIDAAYRSSRFLTWSAALEHTRSTRSGPIASYANQVC